MEFVRFFLLAFLLLAVAQCDYWGEYQDSINYSYLPTTVLGNFEGSYTSNEGFGRYTSICQDDDVIFGAYDQVGIFSGNVTGNTASGDWYEAGTGSCVNGAFEIELNTDGFSGWYTCGSASTRYNWTETKKSPFRPSDDECALIDLNSPATLSGRYEDQEGLAKDFCSQGGKATISYLYYDENNQLQKGYFEGKVYLSGKLFIGTWYSLLPSAGADLYYLSSNGDVKGFFWTGLDGTSGNTVINPAEYRQSNLHGLRHYTGPIAKTTSANCEDYSSIKTKVLNNLVPDNDDDLYYFITSDFNYIVDDDGGDDDGAVDDEDYSSDASKIWLSLPVLLLAFLF